MYRIFRARVIQLADLPDVEGCSVAGGGECASENIWNLSWLSTPGQAAGSILNINFSARQRFCGFRVELYSCCMLAATIYINI